MFENEVTIVIKTFNRKQSLIRLLKSIEKYYKKLNIIIADDSKKNYKKEILESFRTLKIEYHILPFDSGLSFGRNYLLNKVKTEYFILCDDDFEFFEKSRLEMVYGTIKKNNFDIIGGSYLNILEPNSLINIIKILKRPKRILNYIYKTGEIYSYNAKIKEINDKVYLIDRRDWFYEKINKIYLTDIVQNFFIGKTDKIKKMSGWFPEELKMGEHTIFFIRAKEQNLKTGWIEDFEIKHYPKQTLNYYKYRKRASSYFKLGCEKLGIKVKEINE